MGQTGLLVWVKMEVGIQYEIQKWLTHNTLNVLWLRGIPRTHKQLIANAKTELNSSAYY